MLGDCGDAVQLSECDRTRFHVEHPKTIFFGHPTGSGSAKSIGLHILDH
jgi:hypothetical protein